MLQQADVLSAKQDHDAMASALRHDTWVFAGIVHAEALQEPVKAEVLFKEVFRVSLRPYVLSTD